MALDLSLDSVIRSPSKTLFVSASLFCVGILAGLFVPSEWRDIVFSALLICAVLMVWITTPRVRYPLLFTTLFLLGVYRTLVPIVPGIGPVLDSLGRQNAVAFFLGLRDAVAHQLALILPEPHASFVSGLLLGGSSALSYDLRSDFVRTGTSHILAASGFNVSLFSLVLLGWLLQSPLGRKRGLVVTFLLLVAYVCIAGATAAVVRAGVMASLVLVGHVVRRKPFLPNVIALTAALMLLVDPRLLTDVGFQLSFVATVAILYVAPRMEPWFAFVPETFELRDALVGSLAAILLTLPIVIWHFGSVSIVAPFVNLLILPLVPLMMAISIVGLVVSILSPSLALFVMLPVWALSSVSLHIVSWYAALPFASVSVEWAHTIAILSAALIVYFLWRALPRVTARVS